MNTEKSINLRMIDGFLELPAMEKMGGLSLEPHTDPRLASIRMSYSSALQSNALSLRMPLSEALDLHTKISAVIANYVAAARRQQPD